jgi:peptidylprolyl isomerase
MQTLRFTVFAGLLGATALTACSSDGNSDGANLSATGLDAPADVAAAPADAAVTASGLASRVLMAGEGDRRPLASSTVRVHYTGWQTNGQRFDSSVAKGTPSEFALGAVIAGWTEGLQLMVEGEKRRFWIPQELAYRGAAGYPSGMLVFDVELLEIITD